MSSDKAYKQESDNRLYLRQTVLFRAFFINLAFIVVAWGLGFVEPVMEFSADMIHLSVLELDNHLANWLAVWSIAGVVLFFVPAVATYWARFALKKM